MAESESPAGAGGVLSDRRIRLALAALALVLGASGTLISLVSQGLWDPPELETAELSRRIAHGLLGAQALAAPDDGGVPTRGELGRGELPYTLIALGFRLFGLAPWAGRAPLALLALLGLIALHVYVRRLGSSRAAWLAVLVLVTLPPYFLHARTMLGDIATMATGILAMVGLGLATFDAASARRRTAAVVVASVGLLAGFLCRGLLIGVAVPALGVGLAWLVARLAGASFDRAATAIGGASVGLGKLPSAFRCRHMITVYAVQSLAPDVVYFLSQAAGAILRRGQLEAVA
jgi:4-amino-4-deoxy-L-arabinose transferase-like glycosyltransferase